jgi:hypothetical protein
MINLAAVPILVVVTIVGVTKIWKKYKEGELNKKSFVLNVAILMILISFSGYLLVTP